MLRSAWEGHSAAPSRLGVPEPVIILVTPIVTVPVTACIIHGSLALCGVHAYIPPAADKLRALFDPAALIAASVTGTALAMLLFAAASTAQVRARRMFLLAGGIHVTVLIYLAAALMGANHCL